MSCSRTKRSDAGEARTRGPSISSQDSTTEATTSFVRVPAICRKKHIGTIVTSLYSHWLNIVTENSVKQLKG